MRPGVGSSQRSPGPVITKSDTLGYNSQAYYQGQFPPYTHQESITISLLQVIDSRALGNPTTTATEAREVTTGRTARATPAPTVSTVLTPARAPEVAAVTAPVRTTPTTPALATAPARPTTSAPPGTTLPSHPAQVTVVSLRYILTSLVSNLPPPRVQVIPTVPSLVARPAPRQVTTCHPPPRAPGSTSRPPPPPASRPTRLPRCRLELLAPGWVSAQSAAAAR